MAATIDERFQAAVNVIKGLPKNGPYQPSTAMMLKFYGYYKQATEGPCPQRKPAFWDIVGKAKWDAWNSNSHLSKQQAMQKYVEGLREIIETMSFTENVQNFVGSISGLDNINLDELDLIAPGMREMAVSHPNSPFNSRTNSPQHGVSANKITNGYSEEISVNGASNGHQYGDVSSDANDGPTPPSTPPLQEEQRLPTFVSVTSLARTVDQSDDEYGDPDGIQHDISEAIVHNSELLRQIQATVLRMNADLIVVNQRMGALENCVQDVRNFVQKARSNSNSSGAVSKAANARHHPKWWPFGGITPAWFVLLVMWPFVVKRVSQMLVSSRRK